MQIITDFLGHFVGFFSTGFIMVGFSKLIKQMKKTNHMRTRSHLISIVFSVLMLVFNVLVLKDARINWLFVFFLIFGTGFGFAWGKTTVLNIQEDKVVGKRSVIYIYFWIASLAITQVLALFAKANVVALGLAGMFFSTGASLGTNSNILYRMKHLLTSSQKTSKNNKGIPKITAKDKYCGNCGHPFKEKDKFCMVCGVKVPQIDQDINNFKAHVIRKKTPIAKTKKKSPRLMISVIAGILIVLAFACLLMIFISADQASPADVGSGDREAVPAVPESLLDESQQEPEGSLSEPLADGFIETPQDEITIKNVLIFSEDFDSDDTTAVPLHSDKYMHFFRPKGFGYIESTSYTGVLSIMFPENKLGNFVVEFDFKMPEAYDDSGCGLIFRSDVDISDGLDECYALFLYPKSNQVEMGVWVDNEWTFSEYMEPDPPFHQGSDLNHVRLEVSGESQNVYINGVFLANFSNQTLIDPGLVGLFLYPSSAVTEGEVDYVFFDNFQVFEN